MDELRLGVGVYADVSHEDYHADPGERPSLSSGVAKVIVEESPLHAHLIHPRLGAGGVVHSRVFDRGTMVHLLLLGKGQAFVEIETTDYKTKVAQQQRDAAWASGLVPVLSRELEEYRRLAEIFRQKLKAQIDDDGQPDPVLFDGESELTGLWEEDGVLCRLRADHWRASALELLDVKTTIKSVSPRAIARQMYDNGTDIQCDHYTRGMEKLVDAQGRVRMRFVYLEMKPPYDVVVAEPDGTMRELGSRRRRRAKDRWAACLKADDWPGHSGGRTIRIAAPGYALHGDLDAEVASMVPFPPDF